jgi:dynein assembly factor 5
MAIACLYTLLHEGKLSRDALYETAPQLLPVLKTNLEDYDSTTRQLSCLSVAMLLEMLPGALGEDPVREMYPELLKRLDDSNDDVRRAGCNALAALFLSASPPAIQGTPLEYSVEQLLIHLDDKDTTIQEGVMKPLRVAASIDRPMVARKAAEARSNLLNPHFCDELLQAS